MKLSQRDMWAFLGLFAVSVVLFTVAGDLSFTLENASLGGVWIMRKTISNPLLDWLALRIHLFSLGLGALSLLCIVKAMEVKKDKSITGTQQKTS